MSADALDLDAQVGRGELDLAALDAELPPVEVWARPATPDELVSVSVSAKGRTTRRKRPAAALAETATAKGWTVRGPLYARGPLTRGVRQEESNADGVRPIIPVTTVEDSLALRLADPAGTHLIASWAGGKATAGRWVVCTHPAGRCPRVEVGKGTKTDPRREAVDCSYRTISIEDLKALVEAGPRTEEAAPMPEPKQETERRSEIEEEGYGALGRAVVEETVDIEGDAAEVYVAGYLAGYDAANERAGNAFEEGYAQGIGALAGRPTCWVKTRRRLDALRPRSESYPGDVVLGKGDRWWIVTEYHALPARQWHVIAYSGEERLDVRSERKRYVDVVEEVALADALAALKEGDLPGTPIEGEVA